MPALIGLVAGGLLLALSLVPVIECAYLLVLALAACGDRARASARSDRRLAVLVPAHDEALLVGRCVSSLLAQGWPADRRRVIVIADNCTDTTADRALEAGAEVWVRSDPLHPGKGRALRWAIDRLMAGEEGAPDAVVVVDADSVADRDFLANLDARLGGAGAAQADYLVLDERASPRARLVGLAFRLFHRVRLGGRDRLGLPAALVGNGMAFTREVLGANPWDAFSGVEDLEYTLRLRISGVRPAFAPGARIRGPVAADARGSVRQRERWEGGRLHAMRTWLPRLGGAVLRGRIDLLDALVDLAVPPLSILGAVVLTGLAAAFALAAVGAVPVWSAVGWIVAAAALLGYVGVGALAAGAAPADALALLALPGFLLVKAAAYARVLRAFDPARFDRTDRGQDAVADVGGVRIDALTMNEARTRLRAAIGTRRLHQVVTVNMDFVASAQRDAEVRSILNSCEMSVADGAPVVWLGRLGGFRVPERVAGADLVPLLLEDAARANATVFLLGGENGAAEAAAQAALARWPELKLAGVFEPPRGPLETIDSDAIAEAISSSGADIVLVALGHPKQDLWIARNRHRLPVSIAIGVGCVFDLLAGRSRRAPAWMRRAGLEWLYRLLREPRRLSRRYLTDFRWMAAIALRGCWKRLLLAPGRA